MKNRKEILERMLGKELASRIQASHLLPILQKLDSVGTTVRHLTRLEKDNQAAFRVAQSIQVGGWPISRSESRILNIFEPDRVMMAEESVELLAGLAPGNYSKVVPYSEKTIRVCDKQNRTGVASWRLVYVHDLDPFKLFEHRHFAFCESRESGGEDGTEASFRLWSQNHTALGYNGYRLINALPNHLQSNMEFLGTKSSKDLHWHPVVAPPIAVIQMWLLHRQMHGTSNLMSLFSNDEEWSGSHGKFLCHQAILGDSGTTVVIQDVGEPTAKRKGLKVTAHNYGPAWPLHCMTMLEPDDEKDLI